MKEFNKNIQTIHFSIGGLIIQVIVPIELNFKKLFPTFYPFYIEDIEGFTIMSKITLSLDDLHVDKTKAKLLSDKSVVWGDRFCFYEVEDSYFTEVNIDDLNSKWRMSSNKDFTNNIIQVSESVDTHKILTWMIMVVFAQSGLQYNAVLLHASVVFKEDIAYGFLGKSGTGKSTHSRLWLNHLHGYELLNDDNPVVRIFENGEVIIFGSPWSGKTSCYKSRFAKLGGLVRLKQAPYNKFTVKEGKSAVISLLPSASGIRWNDTLYNKMTDIIIEIINKIPVAELECLPNKDAAILSHRELTKTNYNYE